MLFGLLHLLLFLSTAGADPIELHRMQDMMGSVQRGALVVFDLDNTVMRTNQMLGSDQWYGYRLEELKKQGLTKEQMEARMEKDNRSILGASKVTLIEDHTPELLRKLQRRGVKMIALTARSRGLDETTFRQLASLGVDFAGTAPESGTVDLGASLASRGVIFTSGTSKAAALEKYLEHSGFQPKDVVFVDDREKNVKAFETDLLAKNRSVRVFRYGAVDSYVQRFNRDVAELQLAVFEREGKILSDAEARRGLWERKKTQLSPHACDQSFSALLTP